MNEESYDAHRLALVTHQESEVGGGLPIYASKGAHSFLKTGNEAWFKTDKGRKENFWGVVLSFGWGTDNRTALVAKLHDKPEPRTDRRAAIAHSRTLAEASDD